jgi:DNA polymerase I-like protein with 3'-5' exonuclease and polymerase domains
VRVLSLHTDGNTYLIDCREADPTPALEAIEDKLLYLHGAEFDLPYLYHAYGFVPTETPIDTLHLSQVVRAGEWKPRGNEGWQRVKHSLEEALLRELGIQMGDKTTYQKGKAWKGELTEEHAKYATNDVLYLKPLAERLFALLKDHKLEEIWELEQRAKPLFLDMCYRGIPFDRERWDALVNELEVKVHRLKERADLLAPPHPDGETWSWFSSRALEAFKLAGVNVPNLQRDTLRRYDDPFVRAVSEYRDARNELSRTRTWYEGRYKDGRVYSQWNPGGAVTGRASCTSPNIQSLTKEGDYRNCIRP